MRLFQAGYLFGIDPCGSIFWVYVLGAEVHRKESFAYSLLHPQPSTRMTVLHNATQLDNTLPILKRLKGGASSAVRAQCNYLGVWPY